MGKLEDWVSGLNQQFTKLPSGKLDREFESHILRKQNPARGCSVCGGKQSH